MFGFTRYPAACQYGEIGGPDTLTWRRRDMQVAAATPSTSVPKPQASTEAMPAPTVVTAITSAPLTVAAAVAAAQAVTIAEEVVEAPAAATAVDTKTVSTGVMEATPPTVIETVSAEAAALPSIMVDGVSVTLEALKARDPAELGRLATRLERAAQTVRGVRASKQ